jgi:hypothetical protein
MAVQRSHWSVTSRVSANRSGDIQPHDRAPKNQIAIVNVRPLAAKQPLTPSCRLTWEYYRRSRTAYRERLRKSPVLELREAAEIPLRLRLPLQACPRLILGPKRSSPGRHCSKPRRHSL